jgi:hypothetical protein
VKDRAALSKRWLEIAAICTLAAGFCLRQFRRPFARFDRRLAKIGKLCGAQCCNMITMKPTMKGTIPKFVVPFFLAFSPAKQFKTQNCRVSRHQRK